MAYGQDAVPFSRAPSGSTAQSCVPEVALWCNRMRFVQMEGLRSASRLLAVSRSCSADLRIGASRSHWESIVLLTSGSLPDRCGSGWHGRCEPARVTPPFVLPPPPSFQALGGFIRSSSTPWKWRPPSVPQLSLPYSGGVSCHNNAHRHLDRSSIHPRSSVRRSSLKGSLSRPFSPFPRTFDYFPISGLTQRLQSPV